MSIPSYRLAIRRCRAKADLKSRLEAILNFIDNLTPEALSESERVEAYELLDNIGTSANSQCCDLDDLIPAPSPPEKPQPPQPSQASLDRAKALDGVRQEQWAINAVAKFLDVMDAHNANSADQVAVAWGKAFPESKDDSGKTSRQEGMLSFLGEYIELWLFQDMMSGTLWLPMKSYRHPDKPPANWTTIGTRNVDHLKFRDALVWKVGTQLRVDFIGRTIYIGKMDWGELASDLKTVIQNRNYVGEYLVALAARRKSRTR